MTDLTQLGGSAFRSVMEKVGRGVSRVQERRPLSYDLLESDDAYLVVFDAPGVEREDVQVRFVDGGVEVRLDRFREFHEGTEMRFPGRGLALTGKADLPRDALVEPDTATATLTKYGTLHVTIPKSEDATDVPVDEEEDGPVVVDTDADDSNDAVPGAGAGTNA
jgi:HSP20 family protein